MTSTSERDRLLDWAVGSGRIQQGDRAGWAARYGRDPVGTTRQLGAMRASAASARGGPGGPLRPVASASGTGSVATADERSEVLPGSAVFPSIPAGQGQITLSRGEYEVMRTAATLQVNAAFRRVREDRLRSAISTGRIAAASAGQIRARYNADPVATRRELDALPAGVHRAPAATSSSPARASVAAPAAATVTQDARTGALSFRGYPAALGADGQPHVFTGESGWMSVAAFNAAGFGEEQLGTAYASAHLVPGSPTARAFLAGPTGGTPPAANPLFAGGS